MVDLIYSVLFCRGERAFCSQECRYREMLSDGEEVSGFDSDW